VGDWSGDLLYAGRFLPLSGLNAGNASGGARQELHSVINRSVAVLFRRHLLGPTRLTEITAQVSSGQIPYYTSVWLGMLAFAFASFVEMGRLPFDLGEAEQELQEGPITEFSGRSLALMKWGTYLKQMTLVALFVAVFFPFGSMHSPMSGFSSLLPAFSAVCIFLLKVLAFYFVMAVFENAMARLRFLKASSLTWTALAAAILSFVFYLANV
jgi:hydrogenase-4 component C